MICSTSMYSAITSSEDDGQTVSYLIPWSFVGIFAASMA